MSDCIFKKRLQKYEKYLDDYKANHKDKSDLESDPHFKKLQHKVHKYTYLANHQELSEQQDNSSFRENDIDEFMDDAVDPSDLHFLDDLVQKQLDSMIGGSDQTGGIFGLGKSQATKDLNKASINRKGSIFGSLYTPIITYINAYKKSRENKNKDAKTKNACMNVRGILKKRNYFLSLKPELQSLIYASSAFSFDDGGNKAQRARSQTTCEANGLQTIFKICVMDQILGRLIDFMQKPLNLIEEVVMDEKQVKLITHLSQNTNKRAEQYFLGINQIVHGESVDTGFNTGREITISISSVPPSHFNRKGEPISHHTYPKAYQAIVKAFIYHYTHNVNDIRPTRKAEILRQLKNSGASTYSLGKYGRASFTYVGPDPNNPNSSMVSLSLQSLDQSDIATTDHRRPWESSKRARRDERMLGRNEQGATMTADISEKKKLQFLNALKQQPLHDPQGCHIIAGVLTEQHSIIQQELQALV